jgi:hypothetical protein
MTGDAQRVLCQAVVDPHPLALDRWLVTVEGKPPHDETRSYCIKATSDTIAAQEGIARFVAEMRRGLAHGEPS